MEDWVQTYKILLESNSVLENQYEIKSLQQNEMLNILYGYCTIYLTDVCFIFGDKDTCE